MNRRDLLTSAPVALALPAVALADTDTPILALFRRHRELVDQAEAHPSLDDDEIDRLFYHEANAIRSIMMGLPCTCAADFAAKVIVETSQGELMPDWDVGEIWAEARALVA